MAAPSMTTAARRFIIHLDVNKTIIFVDPAANATARDVICSLIADNVWGEVMPAASAEGSTWRLCHPKLRLTPPTPAAVSYFTFVKSQFPYVNPPPGANSDQLAALREDNHAKRMKRKALIHSVVDDGAPAAMFHPVLTALLARLGESAAHPSPTPAASATTAPGAGGMASGGAATTSGDHSPTFLVPSYFRLLDHLACRRHPFLLTIRTFGSDAANVIAEHNAYVTGRHGKEHAPDGVDLSPLVVRCPLDTAKLSRSGTGQRDTRLSVVHPVRVTNPYRPSQLPPLTTGPPSTAVARQVDGLHPTHPHHDIAFMTDTVVGYRAIYDWLHDRIPLPEDGGTDERGATGCRVLGAMVTIRDDFEWWFQHAEQGPYGKLLPLNEADTSTFQIFLDDNIAESEDAIRILHRSHCDPAMHPYFHFEDDEERSLPTARDTDSSIVDARNVHTGAHLPFHDVGNVHMVRVDPISTILNPDYFVELLHRCEARWLAALSTASTAMST